MDFWIVWFASGALGYALATTAALVLLSHALGRFPGWQVVPFVLFTLTFVFLTQHPFPAPGTLDCPVASATPQLQPFNFMQTAARLYRRGTDLGGWLGNRTILATAMNYLLCVLIGVALRPIAGRLRHAVLFGAGLTLTVELTQLTGIWGLYPCAYRQFNVDDLILNLAGVVTGFVLASGVRRLRRAG